MRIFKPFSTDCADDQRVKELMERLVLWVVPEFVPHETKTGIPLDHAGLNLRQSTRHHPRGRSARHLVPESMNAFIVAALAVGLPVETAWTWLRRVEGRC